MQLFFDQIKNNIANIKYIKRIWLYKNRSIVLDLDINGNNIAISTQINSSKNNMKVWLFSRNMKNSLDELKNKISLYIDDAGHLCVFEEDNINIEKISMFINKIMFEVILYLNSKSIVPSVYIDNKNKSRTICVFSTAEQKKGTFTFFKIFKEVEANIIYINDYNHNWHLKGTPDFSNDFEFLDFMKEELKKLNTLELFTFGHSQGGYGALKYGSLLKADSIIAIGTNCAVGLPFNRWNKHLSNFYMEGDISKLKYKNPERVYLFAGSFDFIDYYSASKIKYYNPEINTIIIPNDEHYGFAKRINDKFGFSNITSKIFFEKDISILSSIGRSSIIDFNELEKVLEFRLKYENKNYIDISQKNLLLNIVEKENDFALIYYYLALISKEENDLVMLNQYLNKSIFFRNKFPEAKELLSKLEILE